MKKSIKKMAVVAMMLVAGSTMTVNAQLLSEKPRVHFGIRGGVSASSYSGDGIKSKIFPMGGFAVDFKVAPIPLYLESGLYYVNRGYKLDIPDEYYYDEQGIVKTMTNHNGGITGGISNGMPITVTVSFKPTPSIAKKQNTINVETKENVELEIKGRHDPCIVQRAVVVVEAMMALGILDMMG